MIDLKFLAQYSGESVERLLGYEGQYRIDSLVLAFEEAIQAKMGRGEDLSSEETIVLAVEALEREVNNGGYDQFFRNPTKTFASVIVDALARIECDACARITAKAIEALQIKGPLTEETIDRAIAGDSDDRDSRLRACDDAYFSNDEDIAGNLFAFLKANRQKVQLG